MEPRKSVILGREFAAAKQAEAQRLGSGNSLPSPLGSNIKYSPGEQELYRSTSSSIDDLILQLCRRFESLDDQARASMRSALSLDDFYTLLAFAKRRVALSLRERRLAPLTDAVTALAMIQKQRIDWRDLMVTSGLIYCACKTIGTQCDALFQSSKALAEPAVAEVLTGYPLRPEAHGRFETWGYTLRDIRGSFVLIQHNQGKFSPSIALDQVALELADIVRTDKYDPTITLAATMPPIWLSQVDDVILNSALGNIIAAASIWGHLRPEFCEKPIYQQFTIFLVELKSQADAEVLLRIAEAKSTRRGAVAMIGVNAGPVFCLVIARCAMQGGSSFETSESIQRFAEPIRQILIRATQK